LHAFAFSEREVPSANQLAAEAHKAEARFKVFLKKL